MDVWAWVGAWVGEEYVWEAQMHFIVLVHTSGLPGQKLALSLLTLILSLVTLSEEEKAGNRSAATATLPCYVAREQYKE
eukprot:1156903-Pelagomonas_calceolata.AAC.11